MGRTPVALCPSHDAQELDRGCLALSTMFPDGLDPQRIHCAGKPFLFSSALLIVGAPSTCDTITFMGAAPCLWQHDLIQNQALYSVLNMPQSQH